MERFTGTIAVFAAVDVKDLSAWIKAIPFEEWPQQHKLADGKIRPSMVTDLEWHGFGRMAHPVVSKLGFQLADTHQWMLSVVMPGHSIPPHVDQQPDTWCARVHVPLTGNKQSVTIMEDGRHNLIVGKAYLVNTTKTHAIENRGKTPRIHFMFDCKGGPNGPTK